MKAKCAVCGRGYEVSADGPLGNCVSCGGQLKPVAETAADAVVTANASGPAPQQAAAEAPIELAGESLDERMKCPNCGKWIEAGAQICTSCGYSRRLARTLTTRVGTPEMLKARSKAGPSQEAPEIDAEKKYRRAQERARIGRGDWLRLIVAAISLLALAAMVMAAPMNWLGLVPLKFPPLLGPPRFDALNASFMMLMFLVIAVPITAISVRIAAAITNTEISTYFSWLRTAGVLAAVFLTTAVVFSLDHAVLHLPMLLLLPALAASGGIVLLLFTWFLHDVNFSGAIVLALATLVSAAIGLFAAAAAFAWVGNFVGIDPVIRLNNLFLR